jgi:hypothetical protein
MLVLEQFSLWRSGLRPSPRHDVAGNQCAAAATYADQSITDPELKLFEQAFAADHCPRDKAALSAHHGSVDAQKSLANLGKPVPMADFPPPPSEASGDNAATLLMLLGAGISGFNQGRGYGQPSPTLISTSCTTTSGITNCLSF